MAIIKNISVGIILRGCAHGEEITDKYKLVAKNGKKIECLDNEYQVKTK